MRPGKLAASVVAMQKSILLEADKIPGATELWQDELSRQYLTSNYTPLPSGHQLAGGRWTVLMQLNGGGMEAVYLAQQTNKTKVIVKEAVLPLDLSEKQTDKAVELFLRQVRLLQKLDHPQVVRVIDHFVEQGRNYLVLDFMPGTSLRQQVRSTRERPESEVLDIAMQIADILHYLHSQDPPVLHRDLTPDNLILDAKGRVALIEFGSAGEFISNATGTMICKQSYIAPEQFRGRAIPQSDLYSFGGTLHYLLTGVDPVPLSVSSPKSINPAVSVSLSRLV